MWHSRRRIRTKMTTQKTVSTPLENLISGIGYSLDSLHGELGVAISYQLEGVQRIISVESLRPLEEPDRNPRSVDQRLYHRFKKSIISIYRCEPYDSHVSMIPGSSSRVRSANSKPRTSNLCTLISLLKTHQAEFCDRGQNDT